ncbi:hypothetical protein MMC27_006278 [Xylographa pallens]|nr:hypothetical protein [Xylographa pallens]
MPTALVTSQHIQSAIEETINVEETSGTSHRKSLHTSNLGSFTAAASSIIDNRLWAIPDPIASTTLDLDPEKTLQKLEHGPDCFHYGRDPASIIRKDTDMTVTTLQKNPQILRMGLSKQHRKSEAFWFTRQPALRPKMGSSGIVPSRREIVKKFGENSTGLLQSQQKGTKHLLRKHAYKRSKCDGSIQQKESQGLVRRRFREPERIKVAKVRKLGSSAEDNCKRHRNTLAMYHAMVTGYSNVCRGAASPFSAGWRVEDHTEAFGNDSGLMEDFKAIMELEKRWRAFFIILAGKIVELMREIGEERMDEDDAVFRKLVVDRKERARKPLRK